MIKTVTISVFLLLFLVGCNLHSDKPPIEISASQLKADYKENPSIADEKYEGRTLIVTGNISHDAEIRGKIYVYLERSSAANEWLILCSIDKSSHPDTYSKLKQKQNVTFIGRSERDTDSDLIWLTNCEIK